MGDVKLVGVSLSLYCYRVEWALKVKGVEYEYIEEDLGNKSPLLLKHNPVYKKVPVLLHDGNSVPESHIILEYIDETWKQPPLFPEEPSERAKARFLTKLADEKIVAGLWEAFIAESRDKEEAKESAWKAMKVLDGEIQGKKFFGGETMGLVDIVVGSIPLWIRVIQEVGDVKVLDPERFPSLHKWAHSFYQIPVIKECLPSKDEMVSNYRNSRKYRRSLATDKK